MHSDRNSLYQLKPCPLLRFITPNENRTAEYKIHAHTYGNSDNTPAEIQTKQGREKQPCANRQRNGNDHRKGDITCCAQAIA